MKNFSDFINNNREESIKTESKKEYSNDDLQSMIDRYSGYSNDALMNEFIRLTLEKKKRGELNSGELEKLKSTIEPMLNQEQKVALENIMNMVKNVK